MGVILEMPAPPTVGRGQILFIKASGETVTVLGREVMDSENVIVVRRPVQSDKGLVHVEESFFPEELETFDEKVERRVYEIQTERQAAKRASEEPKPVN